MGSRLRRSCPLVLALASGCPDDASPIADTSTGAGTTGTTLPATTSTTSGVDPTSSEGSTTGAPDLPPPVPVLLTPEDGAIDVELQTSLCWEPVVDPEGDAVRYRVFVDELELTQGMLGEEGWPGPCVGPLDFVHGRTYAWQVQAFEVDEPTQASAPSAAFTFTTIPEPDTHVVFEDGFDDDLGWTVSGTATQGAWVRGNPDPATDGDALSQPTQCDAGESCFFTGQNVDAAADDEDVAGGSTVLTSPAFDLGGAAAATVRLRRFFYRSDPGAGPLLRVELLVPDDTAEGGYAAHELERLDAPTALAPANLWTPREYAACGVPMADGSRLRITATDEGAGILEAAIDGVSVRAHDFATVCNSGEDGICDPALGDAACPDALLCCAQGPVNVGVNRCTPAVPGLDFDDPTADPRAPGNGPLGCDAPDLFIDPTWVDPTPTDIDPSEQTCLLFEGCVDAAGPRRILRFTLDTPNIGSMDLVLGVPANQPDIFHFSDCHEHYHFDEYARYELRSAVDDAVAARGHKQAFCLLDSMSWAWPLEVAQFDCANQGISRGFTDRYEDVLPCQWIDITDVPPGDYVIRAVLNQPRPEHALPTLVERDYTNNTMDFPVTIE